MCSYCPQSTFLRAYSDTKKVMTLDDFKSLLMNIPKTIQIHFSGFSESMLNDDSIDMMIHAYNSGYEVVLYTTFIGFNVKKALKLKESNIVFTQSRPHEFDGIGFNKDEFYSNNRLFLDNVKTLDHRIQRITNPTSRGGHLHNIDRKIGRIKCSTDRVYNNVLLPNGDVYLCCSDWGLKHKIGNLFNNSYNSDEFNLNRTHIIEMQLQFDSDILCRTCEDSYNI